MPPSETIKQDVRVALETRRELPDYEDEIVEALLERIEQIAQQRAEADIRAGTHSPESMLGSAAVSMAALLIGFMGTPMALDLGQLPAAIVLWTGVVLITLVPR